jgi:hypothetical protein
MVRGQEAQEKQEEDKEKAYVDPKQESLACKVILWTTIPCLAFNSSLRNRYPLSKEN